MRSEFEKIAEEAAELPNPQKLALAGLLLELADRDEDSEAEAAWESEIQARIRAIDEGRAKSHAYEDVLRELHRRLAS